MVLPRKRLKKEPRRGLEPGICTRCSHEPRRDLAPGLPRSTQPVAADRNWKQIQMHILSSRQSREWVTTFRGELDFTG